MSRVDSLRGSTSRDRPTRSLEYDGSYHSDPLQQAVDQRRPAALARLGWKVLHMTSSDLHDPHRTLMELRGLLAA
jgi:very-short-patch-repair endonuclease